MPLRPLIVGAVLAGAACAPAVVQDHDELRSIVPLAAGLSFADARTIASSKDFLRDYVARPAPGLIHAVVEIPAGTNEKWEVGLDGIMRWDTVGEQVRVVRYLGYPGNYGIVPRAVLGREGGGDGDPLDVVVLGPSLPRGAVVAVRAIGTIRLVDDGEQDDKVLAVSVDGPLGDVEDAAELDQRLTGVQAILRTWFENYKGPGRLQCGGFGGRAEAESLIGRCVRSFENGERNR